jgi:hypothetical protein
LNYQQKSCCKRINTLDLKVELKINLFNKQGFMKTIRLLSIVLLCIIIYSGCKKDSPSEEITPPATLQISISASNDTVQKGNPVTFTWVSNAKSCIVHMNGIEQTLPAANGSKSFIINQTTLFEFIFTSSDSKKTETKSFTIFAYEIPLIPTIVLTATPPNLPLGGGMVKITWVTTNAEGVYYNDVRYDPNNGFVQLLMTASDTLEFTAKGPGGEKTDNVIVTVLQPTLQQQMITSNPLRESDSFKSYVGPDGPWINMNIDYSTPCMLDNIMTFYLTGEYVWDQGLLCAGGTVGPVTFNWSFSGDSLFMEGTHVYLKSIDWDNVVWIGKSQELSWNGTEYIITPIWVLVTNTFIKPSALSNF